MATLEEFLDAHEIENHPDAKITLTGMAFKTGKFHVDDADREVFYDLYINDLLEGENHGLVEQHLDDETIPLYDYDMRFTKKCPRAFDVAFIDDICGKSAAIIRRYTTQESYHFYVLLKGDGPRRSDKGVWKDGVHLVVPDLVLHKAIMLQMREDFLADHAAMLAPFALEPTEEEAKKLHTDADKARFQAAKVYDESIYKKTGWLLYGSRKKDDIKGAWTAKYRYRVEGGTITREDVTESAAELVRLLSIQNKGIMDKAALTDLGRDVIKEAAQEKERARPAKIPAPPPVSNEAYTALMEEDARRFLALLSDARANSYDDWMKVGWALHNISPGLLDDWIAFSQRSPKFTPGECECEWDKMKSGGLGMGSLRMWARHDSPDTYMDAVRSGGLALIDFCDGTHDGVMRAIAHFASDKFVCVDDNGLSFRRFDGTLWVGDGNGLELRRLIKFVVRPLFRQRAAHWLALAQARGDSDEEKARADRDKARAETLQAVTHRLGETPFVDIVVRTLREEMYDGTFLQSLDADPALIAFTNGVWDLREGAFREARPDDRLSRSTGYPFIKERNEVLAAEVVSYLARLHPNHEVRDYVVRVIARQLMGDAGGNLFHLHAGHNSSAGNGKSFFFRVLELVLGAYIYKFNVSLLTTAKRADAHAPMPEYNNWRGCRILYCSEPAVDDKINSGILKELTGGEVIHYRNLYSNDTLTLTPMYKVHLMCNDTPELDGDDEGVGRRVRKIDYMARFVPPGEEAPENHFYPQDPALPERFRDPAMRMEFMRYLLEHFDINYNYEAPESVLAHSKRYLDANNVIKDFIDNHIEPDPNSHFILKDAKDTWRYNGYDTQRTAGKISTLKTKLERYLCTTCFEQRWIGGKNKTNVFVGFKLFKIPKGECDLSESECCA